MGSDAFSVRAVIIILGVVVLLAVGTVCWLALFGHLIPAALLALVSTTVALLVPSPLTKAKAVETEPFEVELVEH